LNADHSERSPITESTHIPAYIQVPYHEDLLDRLAKQILSSHCQADLNDIVVLLPNLRAAPQLRSKLAEKARQQNIPALLGPEINTLEGWLNEYFYDPQQILSDHASTLMLVEALKNNPSLYSQADPWSLATSLGEIFNDLSRQQIRLPDNAQSFIEILRHSYQISEASLPPLTREAMTVHTLWQAWLQQQQQEGLSDRYNIHISQLTKSLENTSSQQHLFLAGYHRLSSAEINWLNTLLQRQKITLMLHGNINEYQYTGNDNEPYSHPDATLTKLCSQLALPSNEQTSNDAYNEFLNRVFTPDTQTDIARRANTFAQRFPNSPANERIHLLTAASAEQEAQAIDIQIRLWLIEKKKNIGIVTEDRRLARRVRALLDRAGISLQDQAGWALSTTRAAAVVERMLETVEEEFDQLPLLDLLKSPFILPTWDADKRLEAAYRLEQDIILHENIGRGIDRYRKHIRYRQNRLAWASEANNPVLKLLADIEQALQPLLNCLDKTTAPDHFLNALQNSMQQLGLTENFNADPAGSVLLDELQKMSNASQHRQLTMTWTEFRSWLGQALEQSNFRPTNSGDQQVQLITLPQSACMTFDALIIAAAGNSNLPGQNSTSAFFNDSVKQELRLPTRREEEDDRFYLFRRLLHSAPQLLVSWHNRQDGREITASPWIDLLQTFHEIAYGKNLDKDYLLRLTEHPDSQIFNSDSKELPTVTQQPRPSAPTPLLPTNYSASSHQRLINCPYQFFASDCLSLKATEEIQSALEKSDYGQRVHRILQAFHGPVQGLPGPFEAELTPDTREAALQLLEKISRAEFARDLEDNAMHKGWLQRWLEKIPDYIDWQTNHAQQWQVSEVETDTTISLPGSSITLKGRLDRIDHTQIDGVDSYGIIDYKTGAVPKQQDVLNGEAVQLPFYALLLDKNISRSEYLKLDDKKVATAVTLDDDELAELRNKTATRLIDITSELEQGAAMPAWGDDNSCKHCTLDGLCRKQTWHDEQNQP